MSREELDGHAEATRKAVCDLQVGGVGGLSAGEGQQGRTGRGRVLAGGLRERSQGQPVQDLESDVVGQLPAAAGAGGPRSTTLPGEPDGPARIRTGEETLLCGD